jgi:general secretion pathway protein G
MSRARRFNSGFTLIELVITVAIVGLLASIALPLTEVAVQRGKEHELRRALRELRDGIDAYKRAYDEGQIARSLDKSGYPPSLAVLVEGAVDVKSPTQQKIRFLRRIPRDPFSKDPDLPAERTWATRAYESPPDNPYPGADVFDVYSRAEGKGLNGIPLAQW